MSRTLCALVRCLLPQTAADCDCELGVCKIAEEITCRVYQDHLGCFKSLHEESMEHNRHTLDERYRHEFRTEFSSVQRELEMFQEAHADSETINMLQDELLCQEQRSSLSDQRLLVEIGQVRQVIDRCQRQENTTIQLEQRFEQLELPVTPRCKIETKDFGLVSMEHTIAAAEAARGPGLPHQ
eukprot:4083009-Amphidinium_carterae.3